MKETTDRYLAAIDAALPGFVEALYLTGSVALGAAMPPEPAFDGVYLDRETFGRQPSDRPVVPFVVNGAFRTDLPCGELNPVLWLLSRATGFRFAGRP